MPHFSARTSTLKLTAGDSNRRMKDRDAGGGGPTMTGGAASPSSTPRGHASSSHRRRGSRRAAVSLLLGGTGSPATKTSSADPASHVIFGLSGMRPAGTTPYLHAGATAIRRHARRGPSARRTTAGRAEAPGPMLTRPATWAPRTTPPGPLRPRLRVTDCGRSSTRCARRVQTISVTRCGRRGGVSRRHRLADATPPMRAGCRSQRITPATGIFTSGKRFGVIVSPDR
jgi:hypothetical protein